MQSAIRLLAYSKPSLYLQLRFLLSRSALTSFHTALDNTSMKYRAEIDGLRAIAIIPVIFFHAGFSLFSGGFVGVDIFFVISGYLITTIILSDLKEGHFSFLRFYEKRARRIFPALFLVMFVSLPFAWLWLLPEDLKSFSKSLYFVTAFCSNILFWKTSGYFDGDAELKPLLHTWSLSVEEQYYLIFPLLILILWRTKKELISVAIATMLLVSLYAADLKISDNPMSAFYFLPYRAWELLMGALIASGTLFKSPKDHNLINQIASAIGLGFVFISIFFLNKNTPYPSYYTLLPVAGAGLLIGFAKPNTWAHYFLTNKLFVATGLISYSAYLWHQPIFAFAKHFWGNDLEPTALCALVVLVFGLSYFSWKYVESPFRSKEKIGARRFTVLSIACLSVLSAIGAAGDIKDGIPSRFSYIEKYHGDIGQAPYYQYAKVHFFPCTPDKLAKQALMWNDIPRCMQSKENSPIDLILLGDSHAEHLFIGISEALTHSNIVYYAKASPALTSNPEYEEIFQEIIRNKNARTVVLSMYWVGKIYALPNNQSFEKELSDTVGFLVKNDKSVVVVNDVPRFPFPSEKCKYLADEIGRSTCEISMWSIVRYELLYTATLEKLAKELPNVRYISLRDLFCQNNGCSMVQNGVVMYRDNHHLNILGSKFVGRKIIEQLPDLAN